MNDSLSIITLILEASATVQFVMIILILASLVSWYIIVRRGLDLHQAKQSIEAFENEFWSGVDLNTLYNQGSENIGAEANLSPVEYIFRAGYNEYNRLKRDNSDVESVLEGVNRAMRISLAREQDNLEQHLPFLATIASVSPYIGLFGTVWGIMNSFRGLAAQHQATLATVAPGISEALVATALGLFAAIPAVIAYNRFTTRSDVLLNSCSTFAEEFASILYRNLHKKV